MKIRSIFKKWWFWVIVGWLMIGFLCYISNFLDEYAVAKRIHYKFDYCEKQNYEGKAIFSDNTGPEFCSLYDKRNQGSGTIYYPYEWSDYKSPIKYAFYEADFFIILKWPFGVKI